MCDKCAKCGKERTLIRVDDDIKLKEKYKDEDMAYGCVCSYCGPECCLCV